MTESECDRIASELIKEAAFAVATNTAAAETIDSGMSNAPSGQLISLGESGLSVWISPAGW